MKSAGNIPFWKKLLSYFTEVTLEHTKSAYNQELIVSMIGGRLQLSTREAIYSYEDKYDNFFRTFTKIQLPEKANVLLLGFGLGSIPYMLEKKFGKQYHYTAVEIDDVVIYLASKYVLPSLTSEIELIQADAQAFVAVDSAKYDLIAMDIFISEKIPVIFETSDFLQDLKDSLTPGGVMLFNRLSKTAIEQQQTENYFRDVFLPQFPSATYVEVKGNRVLVSRKEVVSSEG